MAEAERQMDRVLQRNATTDGRRQEQGRKRWNRMSMRTGTQLNDRWYTMKKRRKTKRKRETNRNSLERTMIHNERERKKERETKRKRERERKRMTLKCGHRDER